MLCGKMVYRFVDHVLSPHHECVFVQKFGENKYTAFHTGSSGLTIAVNTNFNWCVIK